MDTNIDIYLEALQALKEDDLSEKIIKPLFESSGCYRVDFHGGPYEKGKDLIAYLKTPIEDHIIVIQTKKVGDGKATNDKVLIGNLLFQLQQCYLKAIPLHNGKSKKPDSIVLATPYKINSRLLDEIHGHLTSLNGEITLLDGPLLVEKIKENNPKLLNEIMGVDKKVLVQDSSQLKNLELMRALNTEYSIGEVHCYNDLAFFMGNIDSHYLLKGKFTINPLTHFINKEGWESIKKRHILNLEKILNFSPLVESIDSIEKDYSTQLTIHLSEENQEKNEEINKAKLEINLLKNTLLSIKSELNTFQNINNESSQPNIIVEKVMSVWWPIIFKATTTEEYLTIYKDYHSLLSSSKKEVGLPTAYAQDFNDYLFTLKSLNDQQESLNKLESDYVPSPLFKYSFDAYNIEAWIDSHCHFYIDGISKINQEKNISNEYLRGFLENTKNTLSMLELLKDISIETNNVISFTPTQSSIRDGISLSPFNLFDTNYDIAVYGGAGAGKTTTLQMYAKKLNDEGRHNIIYLPLNRLISKQSLNIIDDGTHKDIYKQILSLILISKELDDTDENIYNIDLSIKGLDNLKLIIDGLDEAYNKKPSILDAINNFKKRNPHVQLIVSSRDCVSFISKVSFLGVTLLPFTNEQLNNFIQSWFNENPGLANSLIKDIERNNLKEIVKTPLLATLLCILKKRGIDTPSTEMEIFTRRLKLLCGEYDNFKTIKRNNADSMMLEKAAIRIAYHLHVRNKRTENLEDIHRYLKNDTTFTYSNETCELLINELIDPCNILHFDSLTKSYSFGHLRFQEHLAALELKDNRSREILPLLNKDWWRGTLCLYAQACEFSSLIEDFIKEYGQVSSATQTLKEMTKHRPLKERESVLSLIKQYERTEELDGYSIHTWDEYDDDWRYVK